MNITGAKLRFPWRRPRLVLLALLLYPLGYFPLHVEPRFLWQETLLLLFTRATLKPVASTIFFTAISSLFAAVTATLNLSKAVTDNTLLSSRNIAASSISVSPT